MSTTSSRDVAPVAWLFCLFVGDVRWERQGGIREREEERPETEAAAASQGRGGRGGGRTVQFDEDKRVVPRVTVAILCGRKEATEKAASSKRIVFIVSP